MLYHSINSPLATLASENRYVVINSMNDDKLKQDSPEHLSAVKALLSSSGDSTIGDLGRELFHLSAEPDLGNVRSHLTLRWYD
jgi:hypothetical protein